MQPARFFLAALVVTFIAVLAVAAPASAQVGPPGCTDGTSGPHAALPALDDGLAPAATPTLGSGFAFMLPSHPFWPSLVPQWCLARLPLSSGVDVTASAVRPRNDGLLARLRGTWTQPR